MILNYHLLVLVSGILLSSFANIPVKPLTGCEEYYPFVCNVSLKGTIKHIKI